MPASPAPCVMIQGTASGVGKSLVTTALCRLFARAGYRVAPFKSQNMALNAAVTADGGEIGRAQAAQADAAGLEATVDMNPILLKPEGDDRSQVIVRGVATGSMSFREYERRHSALFEIVAESLGRLRRTHDLVLIEGAGSPAEINLRSSDIVNMPIARLAGAPVLLVGDIDRGGVFAALVGTLALLAPADRALVAGLIINKLRGDSTLLGPGIDELAAITGVPVLGVLPHFGERLVPAEDSLDLDDHEPAGDGVLDIAVVKIPRISNFDDFDPLAAEPGVSVRFVRSPGGLAGADLVILPGTKATVPDLQWLVARGFVGAIRKVAADGGAVLGICGGYQMLGRALHDPEHVESAVTTVAGFGLLPVATTFAPRKTATRVRASVNQVSSLVGGAAGAELTGYEIHAGVTRTTEDPAAHGSGVHHPFRIVERGGVAVDEGDGALSTDGHVVGTYIHGLFANDALRRAVLTNLATRKGVAPDPRWGASRRAGERYERLADIVGAHLDVPAIAKLVGLEYPRR
jgi:adenosylcobyric acid synthase